MRPCCTVSLGVLPAAKFTRHLWYGRCGQSLRHHRIWGTFHSGSVFEITNAGRTRTLYSFNNGTDGDSPEGGLILDSAGNPYGTTLSGGNLNECEGFGCGIVFELTP